MPPYLTQQEAADRLSTYELEAYPTDGALIAASRRLDRSGPFKGARLEVTQEHAFPRTYTHEGDTENLVPGAILDWVALEAMKLSTIQSGGDKPPISSISHPDAGSVTYARPKIANEAYLQAGLLDPYLRRSGSIL